MANADLKQARTAKNDEFYTQYQDIENEMNAYIDYNPDVFKNKTILLPCDDPEWSNFTKYFAQNFEKFKLKKLISTSYAVESKVYKDGYQTTVFEKKNHNFDEHKTRVKGKIFTLVKGKKIGDNRIDINDLDWEYMELDGDFRSKEVKKLQEEADIIITNPPFSLFREFLAWVVEAKKEFLIIGNMNALTYKEVFPLIKNNKLWMGCSIHSGDREFRIPDYYPLTAAGSRIDNEGNKYIRVKGVRWFTNLDHGRRHQILPLMTMKDNLKFSKHKEIRGKKAYDKYDNHDAIDVSFTDSIPSDYIGVMGVPISFLDKYNPEQFELLGIMNTGEINKGIRYENTPHGRPIVNGKELYLRILIKSKKVDVK